MVSTAKKMGITTWGDPNQYGLSITLGAAEVKMTDMATAYGTIANLGQKVTLDPILKVNNYQGDIVIKNRHNYQNRLSTRELLILFPIFSPIAKRVLWNSEQIRRLIFPDKRFR